jgi:WD40 repeat protein
MAFDKEFGAFWINAGNQINSYKAETLELIKSVSTGNHISPAATMSYSNHSLLYGCGPTVLVYSSFDEGRQQINFTESEEVDFSLGITTSLNAVTSIAPLHDGIVVASTEHHTPYLISFEGVQVARFTGHSAGITCLSEINTDTFASGSADQTVRIWDKRDLSSFSLLRHNGIITSMCSLGQIVFTGGTDGTVRQWDLRMNAPRFIGKCEGTPQSMHFSMETGILTVVVSQKKNEEFYDLGKFPPPMMLDGTVSNAVVNFQT